MLICAWPLRFSRCFVRSLTHFADELRDKFAGGLRRPVECNPAKHLALRLCSGQTIALPESGICLKQTWVDFINSVRQPIKERDFRHRTCAPRGVSRTGVRIG
jgi:hypothetical protein